MSKVKAIYFQDEILDKIGESDNFSKRVTELIAKGLLYEEGKANKLSLKDVIEFLFSLYIKKYPKSKILLDS